MKNRLQLSKRQTYWLCQIFGWFSIVFVETINYTFVLVGNFHWEYVTGFSVQAIYGLLVSHFYKILFIKKSTFEIPLKRLWIKGLVDTFSISIIITLLLLGPTLVEEWAALAQHVTEILIEISGRILNQARYIVVWVIIYYMYKILERNRFIMQQKMQSENVLTTIELELLKTQLNPHFLFNALNSIKALVLIDGQVARDAIVKLSELLQFSLSYEKVVLIAIKEEIYNVEKYLELEKIRFGSRLIFHFNISEPAMALQVPPALILTLAENAIKHGITQLPDGGEISVSCHTKEEKLIIKVKNSGYLKGENIKGIGLNNVRARLQHLFGEEADLNIQRFEENSVLTTITYPINYAS